MRRHLSAAALVLATALLPPAPASAQESNFLFSLMGGFGGSNAADFSNSSYQLGFAFATDVKTYLGIRVGELDMGGGVLGTLTSPDLSYVTIAGEYRFTESYYESGLFLGLGFYDLSGVDPFGPGDSSGLGLTLGATAEFDLSRRLSFNLELAGHYTDLEYENLFLTGTGGLGFHF